MFTFKSISIVITSCLCMWLNYVATYSTVLCHIDSIATESIAYKLVRENNYFYTAWIIKNVCIYSVRISVYNIYTHLLSSSIMVTDASNGEIKIGKLDESSDKNREKNSSSSSRLSLTMEIWMVWDTTVELNSRFTVVAP